MVYEKLKYVFPKKYRHEQFKKNIIKTIDKTINYGLGITLFLFGLYYYYNQETFIGNYAYQKLMRPYYKKLEHYVEDTITPTKLINELEDVKDSINIDLLTILGSYDQIEEMPDSLKLKFMRESMEKRELDKILGNLYLAKEVENYREVFPLISKINSFVLDLTDGDLFKKIIRKYNE